MKIDSYLLRSGIEAKFLEPTGECWLPKIANCGSFVAIQMSSMLTGRWQKKYPRHARRECASEGMTSLVRRILNAMKRRTYIDASRSPGHRGRSKQPAAIPAEFGVWGSPSAPRMQVERGAHTPLRMTVNSKPSSEGVRPTHSRTGMCGRGASPEKWLAALSVWVGRVGTRRDVPDQPKGMPAR